MTPSTPSMTRSRRTIRTPTNCPTRSISVSARSRRRDRVLRSSIARSTIRPRSPAPASSSASTPKGCSRSIAAMCGRRMRRPPSSSRTNEATGRRTDRATDPSQWLGPARCHHRRRCAGRDRRGRRGRHDQAAAGSAGHRADRTSHAGIAQRTGERSGSRLPGACCIIFVLATFYRFASSSGCLEISIRTPTFPAQAPGLKESASAQADRHQTRWLESSPAQGRRRSLGRPHGV